MGALFTDADYSNVALYVGRRDPAIWTGAYLAAQSLRLMETGDLDAAMQVAAAVRTIHTWWRISGDVGYLARFAAPESSDARILAALPTSDPEVIQNVFYENAFWRWRGRVSRDQYQGVLLGMSLAYQAISDNEIRRLIRDDVTAFAEQLMREETKSIKVTIDEGPSFDVSLRLQHAVYTDDETPNGLPVLNVSTNPFDVDAFGVLTFTPDVNDYLRQIPGLSLLPDIILPSQAIQLAAAFRVALQVTDGVQGYESRHDALRSHYEEHVEAWLDIAADWENTNVCDEGYSGLNTAFFPMYNWVRLEDNPARRERLQRDVLRDALWSAVADHKNVLFAFIYASQAEPGDAVEEVIDVHAAQLALFPDAPQLDTAIDLRSKYPEDPNCPGLSIDATDVNERPAATFIWERDPWTLVHSATQNLVFPGLDYLLAYWLGRQANFIGDESFFWECLPSVGGWRAILGQ